MRDARIAALDALAAAGIVAVHECAGPDIGGARTGRNCAPQARGRGSRLLGRSGIQRRTGSGAACETTGARGLAGDLFVDGASAPHRMVGEPYADAPGCKPETDILTRWQLSVIWFACTEAGVAGGIPRDRCAAAVRAVVDALARLVERFGSRAVARCGHRLEHLEMVTAEQAAILGQCGVTASMQPNFDALWGGSNGMYARRLRYANRRWQRRHRSLTSAGVPIAFSLIPR